MKKILTLALFSAKVLTTLKGAADMLGFASSHNTVSCTGASAAGYCAANFCGHTYGRLIAVSTAVAVLIFLMRIINILIA